MTGFWLGGLVRFSEFCLSLFFQSGEHDAVRSRTDVAMKNEALCKIIAHNLCCVIQAQCELGIEAVFFKEEDGDAPRAVLQMKRFKGS